MAKKLLVMAGGAGERVFLLLLCFKLYCAGGYRMFADCFKDRMETGSYC